MNHEPCRFFRRLMLQVAESRLGVAMMRRHSLASGSAVAGGRRATDGADLPQDSGFGA